MTTHPCCSLRASGAPSPTFSAWPSTSSTSPGEADCRPAAAEHGETVRAMALQAAAHAAIAALAEKAHTTAHALDDAITESPMGERDDEAVA